MQIAPVTKSFFFQSKRIQNYEKFVGFTDLRSKRIHIRYIQYTHRIFTLFDVYSFIRVFVRLGIIFGNYSTYSRDFK